MKHHEFWKWIMYQTVVLNWNLYLVLGQVGNKKNTILMVLIDYLLNAVIHPTIHFPISNTHTSVETCIHTSAAHIHNLVEFYLFLHVFALLQVTACARCNSRKGQKTPEEANIRLIKIPKVCSFCYSYSFFSEKLLHLYRFISNA